MLQDLRLALRRLGKTPGFTAVTVVTLALAIGANTTTFSALNRFLLRPLPVDRPKELFNVGTTSLTQSYPDYVDLRDRNRTLSGLVAYRIAPVALSQGGKNSHLWGNEATGNYFDLLGVHAFLGRTFTQEDDQRASPHAVAGSADHSQHLDARALEAGHQRASGRSGLERDRRRPRPHAS